jgi:multicomponent K+:H+ antiporter subunit D
VSPHWVVAPVLIPVGIACLLLSIGSPRIGLQRVIGMLSCVLQVAVALALALQATDDIPRVYVLGDWPAPFSIVLVGDRLAAIMLLLTALLACAVLAYASAGWDRRGSYFHALFQLQLMGLNGAFLTGDLFNLFVFFEVLLIASYCLLMHGQGAPRLRATVQYAVINLTASALFLIAVALLYALTGTLNMAHLAQRIGALPPSDLALAESAVLLLLAVFGAKAAIWPLYFWLPGSYPVACAPVAALFAIMTKVGIYAIVRVHLTVFGASGPLAAAIETWLMPIALITLTLGTLGALGAERLGALVAYVTVASVGTIMIAIALPGGSGLGAGLFYLLHSTFIVAALFLLVEIIALQRGKFTDRLEQGEELAQPRLLGWMLLIGSVAAAGLPPLSGFLGKAMILQNALGSGKTAWIWAVVLITGLLTLIALGRAGTRVVWNNRTPVRAPAPATGGTLAPALVLLAASGVLSVAAAPVRSYTDATERQLADRERYLRYVLGPAAQPEAGTTRPLPRGPKR